MPLHYRQRKRDNCAILDGFILFRYCRFKLDFRIQAEHRSIYQSVHILVVLGVCNERIEFAHRRRADCIGYLIGFRGSLLFYP